MTPFIPGKARRVSPPRSKRGLQVRRSLLRHGNFRAVAGVVPHAGLQSLQPPALRCRWRRPQRQLWAIASDAAETDMASRGVNWLRMASRRPVAPTIVRGAEIGAALEHLARDATLRLAGVVAQVFRAAARVFRDTTGLGRVGLVPRTEPVRGPFPDVANHVVEAVVVLRKGADRGRALIAVLRQVLPGKLTLPGIGHHLAAWMQLVPPGKFGILLAVTCREFPCRFRRQILARPLCVSDGSLIGHVHHRMIAEAFDGAART